MSVWKVGAGVGGWRLLDVKCCCWNGLGEMMSRSLISFISDIFALSDEEAMVRVQEGNDSRAFSMLHDRWQPKIVRFCRWQLGDGHRGEDVAQDVFMKLFARREQYRREGQFSSYIWRLAVNGCYDELRRKKRKPELSLSVTDDEGYSRESYLEADEPSVEAVFSEQEQSHTIKQALQRLPEIYRSVIILRHYEGLKFREIAEVMDIPEGTVSSRMAEALNRLEELLKSKFGDEDLSGSKLHASG
ncbi:MAG: RNA polymerase sigma factor [Planctomycetes bacterium]|nr:RNA polymerase sigma factor [Planctomycetota bacterium]